MRTKALLTSAYGIPIVGYIKTDYLKFGVICLSVAIDCLITQSIDKVLSLSELEFSGFQVLD